MANSEKSLGVIKALGHLSNRTDHSKIKALQQLDLVVLCDIFTSGCSVADLEKALDLAKGKKPEATLTQEDKISFVRGVVKKVSLETYLRSEDVRKAYPIPEGELAQVRALCEQGNHKSAISTLQRAIEAGLEAKGKTRRVVVERGQAKTKDQAAAIVGAMVDKLPQSYKAMNISALEVSEGYVVEVRGFKVTSINSKLARAAGRVIAHAVDMKTGWDELKDVPNLTISEPSKAEKST